MAVEPPVRLCILVVGLGAVGRAVAAQVSKSEAMRLVGGVDVNAAALRHAAALFGDLPLTTEIHAAAAADVAIVCVGRRFDRVAPTLRELMSRGTAVVSDCAEMAWPWLRHPHLGDAISNEACKAGVAVVGVGSDPVGVSMIGVPPGGRREGEPVVITIRRHTDLRVARPSVRRHVGVGRTAEQFRRLATDNLVGLPGQAESVVLLAQSLGRHPMRADVRTTLRPLLGDDGAVRGLHQRSAWAGNDLDISIDETATQDVATTADGMEIDFRQGVSATSDMPPAGDAASTAAALCDVAQRLGRLPPGLLTQLDILSSKRL